jgi:uncharacterized protein (TIGR03067 family)
MRIGKVLVSTGVLALLSCVIVDGAPEDDHKEEAKMLQGTWQVTKYIDEDGKEAPAKEIVNHTFQFKGDQVVIHSTKDDDGREFKYSVDGAKKPKAIDIDMGPPKPSEGIYKLEGDKLTICIVSGYRNDRPAPRPSGFKESKEKKYVVFILKKVSK